MKPLTKNRSVSPKSSSKRAPMPRISAKSRSDKVDSKTRTPSGPSKHIKKASVLGLAVPDKTSNQSSVINEQRQLDKLAVIAAILALIAAIIGLYIAWKTLSLPGDTVVTV
ncbi:MULTISPECIES: hypothetical protein [unclassified Paenibacillus]|uniref:hypothetical protein n=1 Tax=unclassified Paenibacillus TaxID=185978 RepID=UPI000464D7F8|nr:MULTISPECIES: hypothetical protein [unclassified Paenibacillus]KGP81828.1 hypothetical protein P364_0115875 [Paenibacillus sp. MAEPY2]KGP86629.1 hypothetical protein P363_0116285 [Paenibacillus sp. MAEPY1]